MPQYTNTANLGADGEPRLHDCVLELTNGGATFTVTGVVGNGAVLGSPNYPNGIDPGYLKLLHRCHHHHCSHHHHNNPVDMLKMLEVTLTPQELLGHLKAFYLAHHHKHFH